MTPQSPLTLPAMEWGPVRIQRRRTRGWKMPPNTAYVGRGTKFGNPFRVGQDGTAEQCVSLYRRGIEGSIAAWEGGAGSIFAPENDNVYQAWESRTPHLHYTEIELSLEALRGKNLACWCALEDEHGNPVPCHADVLLDLANR